MKSVRIKKYDNLSGFSLIELSVVLIIIGFLIAGILGGKSLIDSAKIQSLLSEVDGYKKSLLLFRLSKGRLPGDLNDDGVIGISMNNKISCVSISHETFTTSSFKDYTTKAPDLLVAPFIDLSLEGLIDFKPIVDNPVGPTISTNSCAVSLINNTNLGAALPRTKAYNNLYWTNFITTSTTSGSTQFRTDGETKIFLSFLDADKQTFKVKTAKRIDMKYDDGDAFKGGIRGICINQSFASKEMSIIFGNSSRTYDDAIAGKVECSSMAFEMF